MKTILKALRKISHNIKHNLNKIARYFRYISKRKELRNKSMSVFSSNCVGCCVLHDLGVRFNSPFVNLFLDAKDYIKYLHNPQKYNDLDFVEVESDFNFPVAKLGDITFYFVHYKTLQEAAQAFKRRYERIDYNNLFVIFSERDGCTYDDLKEFDALPYENKIVFTHLPYDDIQSAVYIEGFENEDCVGNLLSWDKKLGSKVYDRFEFISWFNKNS